MLLEPCHSERTCALDELVENHFVDCVGLLSSHFEPGNNHWEEFLSVFIVHVLYPSIECGGLCHWFKCEHDCVTGLKCEYGKNDRAQF